ncbi:MAG TPA: sensor histidine kinase [Niallia sp.]|nr:sensor histidine kinase [Niallia sp.]
MNIITRQILWGVTTSIILFAFFSFCYITVFPLSNWSALWKEELMGVPFVLFLASVDITIGILVGFFSGFSWKRQIMMLEERIHSMVKSKEQSPKVGNVEELIRLENHIIDIQHQLVEQTKLSQKLVNEKAEDQEAQVQSLIIAERNRLARELHDSVSQQLFAASMLLSAINETRPEANDRETKQLKLVEETIQQSQLEMRALLLHLRPVALKGKTLKSGIVELLTELMQKVSLDISWKLEDIELDKGIEDHLFRILQESVSNTLRHAKAERLEVQLIQRESFIILRIMDNGVGFNVDVRKAGSYGLQNMHERASEIGGILKMVSIKNQGTRLEVKVPILEREEESQ